MTKSTKKNLSFCVIFIHFLSQFFGLFWHFWSMNVFDFFPELKLRTIPIWYALGWHYNSVIMSKMFCQFFFQSFSSIFFCQFFQFFFSIFMISKKRWSPKRTQSLYCSTLNHRNVYWTGPIIRGITVIWPPKIFGFMSFEGLGI